MLDTFAARFITAALLALPALAWSGEKLPSRNLLVEWRLSEVASQERQSAGVVVRSDGTGTRAGVTVDTRGSRSGADGIHQVLVLNGSVATLRLTKTRPWQFVQAALVGTASAPRGVAFETHWVDDGQGLQVQTSWFGGDADVVVELHADSAATSGDNTQPTDRTVSRQSVHTTLRMPLGQWVAVARDDDAEQQVQQGVYSTRQARSGTRRSLELRISLH
jgi:hypothetical protein